MSLVVWVPLCALVIIAIIAVLRFGWPTVRWRTYNKVHGDLRVIEIAVMLSPAEIASRYVFGFAPLRFVQTLSEALQGRPAHCANAAATAQNTYRDTIQLARHNAGEGTLAVGDAVPCATPAPPRTARAAECVVYVTLKVGNH